MSLTSNFAITVPVEWGDVLVEARRIIGIPPAHPFSARIDQFGDCEVVSDPGGFDAALIVRHRGGLPLTMDDDSPVTFVRVSLDSQYEGDVGPFVTHRRVTLELGMWCEARGIEWWTCDEPLTSADYKGWVKGQPVWPNYRETAHES